MAQVLRQNLLCRSRSDDTLACGDKIVAAVTVLNSNYIVLESQADNVFFQYYFHRVSSFFLLQQVSYIRKQRNLACTLNSLSHAALILQRRAGDAAGQDFALLVQELLKELGVLVVDVLDAALLETAVFLPLRVNRRRGQISDF